MRDIEYFPVLQTERLSSGKIVVTGGIKIKSILKRDLCRDYKVEIERPSNENQIFVRKLRFQAVKSFLQSISSWPSSLCLDLDTTVLPDVAIKVHGRVCINLFLRFSGDSEDAGKEEIILRYMALMPILVSHFPEYTFGPISKLDELENRLNPFEASHGIEITRRTGAIKLTSPLRHVSMGFGPVKDKRENDFYLNHTFPWVPNMEADESKPLRTLLETLEPTRTYIRFQPVGPGEKEISELENNIETCEKFLSMTKSHQITLNRYTELIREVCIREISHLSGPCFRINVWLLSPHRIDSSMANIIGSGITASETVGPFVGGYAHREIDPSEISLNRNTNERNIYSIDEAACAFRLPSPPLDDDFGLPVRTYRTAMARLPHKINGNEAITLFDNEHHHFSQPVEMETQDRLKHVFILGQTGTGKSHMMTSMICQDIEAGRGVAVIDPHGDMVDDVLGRIPKHRMKDVIFFDMLDRAYPIGFNLLQWETEEERDLIIDEIYTAVDHVYDLKHTGGPIFESNMRGVLRVLMAKKNKEFIPTIVEFPYFYINSEFRKWLLKDQNDAQVRDFINELEKTGGEASLQNLAPYITSKFNRFVMDTTLKRIVGQEKTPFNFDDVINTEKIFLVKLGRGRWGSEISGFLANQLVSRFKLAAMKRGEMLNASRRPYFLYVDEAQTLPADNFTELLSEARKYGLGLILATQYASQISDNARSKHNLLSAVIGNVGTFIIFRIGLEDAEKIGKVLQPNFSAQDVAGLPNWHGYARVQISNETIMPFSFKTREVKTPFSEKISKIIKMQSRAQYGQYRKEIDDRIQKRRVQWVKDDKKY